ncbi:MAG: RIP metalloprotease RseP [Verrucomicrobia bacterium]|nr:MAG: RIP metalloprotease RseP [Verrucomicrobiota bacterium]
MEIFSGLFSSLWSVVVIAVFFGGSIFVHELGHFLAARRRGLRVDRFSIGFGPPILKWTGKDGVEYRLSWFPLGGYVSLPQLADMRQIEGETQLSETERIAIPYGAKVEVLVAGAVFNIIFALILACIVWATGYPVMRSEQTRVIGEVFETVSDLKGEPVPGPARLAGLQSGDVVERVDGRVVNSWADFRLALAVGTGRLENGQREVRITVRRDNVLRTITVNPILSGEEELRVIGVAPADELVVERIVEDSAALAAGVRGGDRLLRIDGVPVFSAEGVFARVQEGKGREVDLEFERDGSAVRVKLNPKISKLENGSERWLIGLGWSSPIVYVHTPPFSEIYRQTMKAYWTLAALISPKSDIGPSKLSGPIGIGRGFHQVAQVDWRLVLWFTVLVNVNLAIMNLMPIPVLDGGHIVFATIGKLRGTPLPVRFMHGVQAAFMALLFTMILYVSFFDVRRIVRDFGAGSQAPDERVLPARTGPAAAPEPAP